MLEREFEDIICKYPELIEDGLVFEGRQVCVDRKFIDIVFKDKNEQTLIIELKAGVGKRKDVAQLLDYAGYTIASDDKPVRIMLVANRIPGNFKYSFDYFGFEYKEITVQQLKAFLESKSDQAFLGALDGVPGEGKKAVEKQPVITNNSSGSTSERNETRQGMAGRFKRGRVCTQAKYTIELLEKKKGPVNMREIVTLMASKGYTSKTYYDLLNSLVDAGLVEKITFNGRYAFQLKED